MLRSEQEADAEDGISSEFSSRGGRVHGNAGLSLVGLQDLPATIVAAFGANVIRLHKFPTLFTM
jgi:hypothetical protein